MFYERSKLEKMEFSNELIEKIIKANVIDISKAIEDKVRDILIDTGDEYKLHYNGFLFNLEKIILKNGDLFSEYDKDLFEKVFEIKLIDSITFSNENCYMFAEKKDNYLVNKYSNFITLIAGQNHFHSIKYDKFCLNYLLKHFNLSIQLLKEEKYQDKDEDYFISKTEFGNVQNFNHINNEVLLVLNEELNICTINDKITGRMKYTLNIVI